MTLFLKAKNGQISYLRNTTLKEYCKNPTPLTTVSRGYEVLLFRNGFFSRFQSAAGKCNMSDFKCWIGIG